VKASVLSGGIVKSISFGLLLFTAGCQQNDTLFGMWQGDRDWKRVDGVSESVARALSAVNLNLKPNGVFELTDAGLPITGQWVRSGNSVTLTPQTFMNTSLGKQSEEVQKALRFEVNIVGDNLEYRLDNEKTPVRLKKAKTSKS
jgi:hypothetical protein